MSDRDEPDHREEDPMVKFIKPDTDRKRRSKDRYPGGEIGRSEAETVKGKDDKQT